MFNPYQDDFIDMMLALFMGLCLFLVCLPPVGFAATPQSSATGMPVSEQAGQRKIIRVWTHMLPDSVEGDVFVKTVSAFEQAQDDYTIEDVVPFAPETYADRIIGSAQSGSLPCVLEFDLGHVYNFAWSGYLEPIDRFVSAELKADFLPSIIAQGTFNGQLYSLGQFDSGMVVYGNRHYLQTADIRIPTFEKPWNLAEF
ncbi:MAG: extracellular solute-binding protein [Candidatus Thiodiazotropha sp.]